MLMEAVGGSSMEVRPHPVPASTSQQTISAQRQLQWCQGQG